MERNRAIYNSAREIFIAKGFKDTKISDIMSKANMATGTFYNYYPSKDNLFMKIFIAENEKLKKRILKEIDLDGEPIDVAKQMMHYNYEGMNQNPILKQWYNREIFSRIERNFRKESGIENVNFMYDQFIKVVEMWQSKGKMRDDIDSEMIMAIFSALVNIDTHKDEVGLKYFPNVLSHITQFVMEGLTKPTKK